MADRTEIAVGSNGRVIRIPWIVLATGAVQLISWGAIYGSVTAKMEVSTERIAKLEAIHTADQLALDSVKSQIDAVKGQVASTHELAAKVDQEIMDFIAEYERDEHTRRQQR